MTNKSAFVLAAVLLLSAVRPVPSGAATITVTGTGDTIAVDGSVTLREAIASINAGANVNADVVAVGAYGTNDTIHFNIPGAGVHTIQPTSKLPATTKPLVIDGYSQPGASANTLAVGNDAVLLIEIDGTNAGSTVGGLLEIGGGNSTIRGLAINRALGSGGIGLRLATSGANNIQGNFIGIDPTGTIARSNGCQGVGVVSGGNTIGGVLVGDRNVIAATAGCGGNLVISSGANNVLNNYFGTNAAGTASLGGSGGVILANGASFNIIGGTTAAARNIISGNGTGVNIFDETTSDNVIEGNYIGVGATGLPLHNSEGVQFGTAPANNNTIGGTSAGSGNVIAFNNGPGVVLHGFPYGMGNRILGNSIYSNGGQGIDIGNNGDVDANDPCDADDGPNGLQNFPVITSATAGAGSITVQGTLNSTASTGPYRIEIFANDSCDPSGYGEGKTFLGSTTTTTAANCNGAFNVTLPVSVSPTAKLTATATAPDGSTSEFSACVGIQTVYFTVTPCRVADTRNPPGPSGGPALSANTVRSFPVSGLCGIPSSARAVAINLAVFLPSDGGDLRVYPAGGAAPLASAINFRPGIVRANNAVVPLSSGGQISVQCDMPAGSTHFFFDVYGYFQ